MALRRCDIFKKETNDSLVWVEAVNDVKTARKRIAELYKANRGDYRIFDYHTQTLNRPGSPSKPAVFEAYVSGLIS